MPWFANVAFGFGNFTNVNNAITNAPAGNGITGPGVLDSRSRLGSPGVSYAGYTTGNSSFTVQDLNEPQSGPSTFKIVLNTNMPHWTLDVFKNGQQMGNEVVYSTNPGTLNEFGISLNGGADSSSVTFSGISLTDSQQVAAVPEASTWAMMMLGFAGLGLLSYRRTWRNGGLNLRFA